MKKGILFMLGLLLAGTSCTSDSAFRKGKKQLEHMGYTDVQSTGYSAFCCDKNDFFTNGFRARDRDGQLVEGCFCSGVLKGVTIRFE